VAAWTDEDRVWALLDEVIICNRATVGNVLAAIEEYGPLDSYLWSFVGGQPRVNAVGSMGGFRRRRMGRR
jgi:3-methyladenine DNA glycosylase Tag